MTTFIWNHHQHPQHQHHQQEQEQQAQQNEEDYNPFEILFNKIPRIATTIIGLNLALSSAFASDSGTRASYYAASYLCAAGLLFFSSGVSGSVKCFSFSCCMYASFFLTSFLTGISNFSEMLAFSFLFVLGCLLAISFSIILLAPKMIGRERRKRGRIMMTREEQQHVHIMDHRSAGTAGDGDPSAIAAGTGVRTEEQGGLLLVNRVEDRTQQNKPTVYAKLYQGPIYHEDDATRGREN